MFCIRPCIVLLSLAAASAVAVPASAQPPLLPIDQTLVENPASAFQLFGRLVAGEGDRMVAGGPSEQQYYVWTSNGWSFLTHFNSLGISELSMRGEYALRKLSNGDVQRVLFSSTDVSPGGFNQGQSSVQAIAIAPDRLAMGYPDAQGGGTIVILRLTGGISWEIEATLSSSDPAERYGAALDFSETGLVLWIGAPGDGTGGTGRVERRVWSGSSWVLFGELEAPLGQADNEFGAALAADGQRLAVGAPGFDVTFPVLQADAGAVYLYQSGSLGALEFEGSFVGAGGDKLGTSVDIHDAAAIAGAPGKAFDIPSAAARPSGDHSSPAPEGLVTDAGEAQLYWRTGAANWEHVALLRRPTPGLFDEHGASVALVGRTALVGTPGLDGPGANSARGAVTSYLGTNAIFIDGFESGDLTEWTAAVF